MSQQYVGRAADTAAGSLVLHRGDAGGLISFYDIASQRHSKTIATELEAEHGIEISPSGRFLVASRTSGLSSITVIDVEKNERLLQQGDVTALGFSDHDQLAVYLHQSRELRVWRVGSEPFAPPENGIAVATMLKIGTVIAAEFIRSDLVLVGTSEGTLALIDWPMRTVVGQLKLDHPIKEIHACKTTDRYLIEHGWVNRSTGLLGSGVKILQWVDCKITEKTPGAVGDVASRFAAKGKRTIGFCRSAESTLKKIFGNSRRRGLIDVEQEKAADLRKMPLAEHLAAFKMAISRNDNSDKRFAGSACRPHSRCGTGSSWKHLHRKKAADLIDAHTEAVAVFFSFRRRVGRSANQSFLQHERFSDVCKQT